ncbi:hypothetical protein FHS02_002942 [Massilia umbonata]|uniref:Uncharacterized protein n=1 Tax=Pseudoduganella umbonata TaxID=864828 RepID=A0A7W5EBJ6_9BURK|nr:hypothetical protein [Pseudoduganella umbonata]
MSALWLLVLPVAGLLWHVVAEAISSLPDCNDDFGFY